jgi:EAL and modified HD-GYP domain-containing signal transduction protein
VNALLRLVLQDPLNTGEINMIDTHFITREPLLDPKQKVSGFQFSWQRADEQVDATKDELDALLQFVAGHLNDDEKGFLLGKASYFLKRFRSCYRLMH